MSGEYGRELAPLGSRVRVVRGGGERDEVVGSVRCEDRAALGLRGSSWRFSYSGGMPGDIPAQSLHSLAGLREFLLSTGKSLI
jgi:hypothetical protein